MIFAVNFQFKQFIYITYNSYTLQLKNAGADPGIFHWGGGGGGSKLWFRKDCRNFFFWGGGGELILQPPATQSQLNVIIPWSLTI